MSVFTEVTPDALAAWTANFSFGTNVSLVPIAAGISNTNYFLDTGQGRYVLTLFEELTLEELPFFLQLMRFLADRGIPCPAPVADNDGRFASMLSGKPAAVVSCLPGSDSDTPMAAQCHHFGAMLAKMHIASQGFSLSMQNPRGHDWRQNTAQALYEKLSLEDAELLKAEMRFQQAYTTAALPHGIIHGDIFKDNVLLKDDSVTGFIDFYYACNDYWLYDVAIALNDWVVLPDGELDGDKTRALLAGYQQVRSFTDEEKKAWPLMLRAGALRFWLSRLLDWYNPPQGMMTYTKDPQIFKKILQHHQHRHDFWL